MAREKLLTETIKFRVSKKVYEFIKGLADAKGQSIKEILLQPIYAHTPIPKKFLEDKKEEQEEELKPDWQKHPLYKPWMEEKDLAYAIERQKIQETQHKNRKQTTDTDAKDQKRLEGLLNGNKRKGTSKKVKGKAAGG